MYFNNLKKWNWMLFQKLCQPFMTLFWERKFNFKYGLNRPRNKIEQKMYAIHLIGEKTKEQKKVLKHCLCICSVYILGQ